MTDLRKAVKIALNAIWEAKLTDADSMGSRREMIGLMNNAIETLSDALEQQEQEQDWDLLKATQKSLREHQARIDELEAQLRETDVVRRFALMQGAGGAGG